MSIDANELDKFRETVRSAERREVVITLSVERAKAILNEIDSLKNPEALKVGDKVEIIGRTTYEGRKGVITHIEPLAKNFPYSVTLFSEHGLAASIVYFGKHQVRKAP